MTRRFKEGILPFKIVPCNEPLVARSGLVLPYEMAKAFRLPGVIDEELPGPGSGRGYKPSQFVLSLILMFHGGGKKLEDLRELKGEMSLRELLEMESLPASCTIGDWLRRMGEDTKGLSGLRKVNRHLVKQVILKDHRNGYTLDVDASIIQSEKEQAKVTYKEAVRKLKFSGNFLICYEQNLVKKRQKRCFRTASLDLLPYPSHIPQPKTFSV
jgi:hypothetical protein